MEEKQKYHHDYYSPNSYRISRWGRKFLYRTEKSREKDPHTSQLVIFLIETHVGPEVYNVKVIYLIKHIISVLYSHAHGKSGGLVLQPTHLEEGKTGSWTDCRE